jgi:hypothetical protein
LLQLVLLSAAISRAELNWLPTANIQLQLPILCCFATAEPTHKEREREKERKWGGSEKLYILDGQQTISPVLKFPRQYLRTLLVEIKHMMVINCL